MFNHLLVAINVMLAFVMGRSASAEGPRRFAVSLAAGRVALREARRPMVLAALLLALAALLMSPGTSEAQSNNPATGLPRVFPSAEGTGFLLADTSGIADADGLPFVETGPPTIKIGYYDYTYQWIRVDGATADETNIGADSPRYQRVDADIGNLIKVQVSFTDKADNEESLTSLPFGPVAEPAGPSPFTRLLVSNTGQSASATAAITQQYAMGFRLGSHGQGYEISGVSIELAAAPSSLTVSLWIAGPEETQHYTVPQYKLFDFTNPDSFKAGLNKFTAPAGAYAYQNVNYWIVLSGFGSSLSIKETTSDDEDAGGEEGAILRNNAMVRALGSTGRWGASTSRAGVLRLALEGSMRDRGILAANYAQPYGGEQEILTFGDLWTVEMDAGAADRYLIRGISLLADDTTAAGGGYGNPIDLWNESLGDLGARRFSLTNTRHHAGINLWTAPQGATLKGSASYYLGQDLRADDFVRVRATVTRVYPTTSAGVDTPTGGVTFSGSIGDGAYGDGFPLMAVLGEPLNAMVSNLGQTDASHTTVDATTPVVSQGFAIGSDRFDYRLQGVGVNIEGSDDSNGDPQLPDGPASVLVSVHADSNGQPGDKLFDLVSPTEFEAGHSFFEAPPGTTLESDTSYVLVWEHLGGTGHRLQRTASDSEDSGGQPGADIANAFHSGAGLDSLSADSGGHSLEIAVYGDPAPGVVAGQPHVSAGDYDLALDADNAFPQGVWGNATTIWVANDGTGARDKLYAYNRSDLSRDTGQDFNTLSAAGNLNPRGIWSDGATMYVVDWFDERVYAYRMSNKSRDSAKDFSLGGANHSQPGGIWSDGATFWVTNDGSGAGNKIYAYKKADGTHNSSEDFDTLNAAGNDAPSGIWSDGTTMYVADNDDDRVYAYQMSDKSRDAGKDFDLDSDNTDPKGVWAYAANRFYVADSGGKLYVYTINPVVWTATLTVDERTVGSFTLRGWESTAATYPDDDLTDSDFVYDSETYGLFSIELRNSTSAQDLLELDFLETSAGDIANQATRDKLSLWVEDTEFPMGAATYVSTTEQLEWFDSLPTWSGGDKVELRITERNLPAMVEVSGTPQEGEVLSADVSDGNGTDNAEITYQWLKDDAEITGAETPDYWPHQDDVGSAFSVRVSFKDDANYEEVLTSDPTDAVQDSDTVNVVWSATMTVGEANGNFGYDVFENPVQGSLSPDTFVVLADTHTVQGIYAGSSATYFETDAAVPVSFSLALGRNKTLDSGDDTDGDPSAYRWSFPNPGWADGDKVGLALIIPVDFPPTGGPAITGLFGTGQTLAAETSGITDPNGLDNPVYAYQWGRSHCDNPGNDGPLGGETGSTYTVAASDLKCDVTVTIDFQDDDGYSHTLSASISSVPGLRFNPPALRVDEGGEVSFTVRLAVEPADDVTVSLSVPHPSLSFVVMGTSTNSFLSNFSTSDWNQPVTVTLAAAHDGLAADESAKVQVEVTSTGDSDYHGLEVDPVPVTIVDDDSTVEFEAFQIQVYEGGDITFGLSRTGNTGAAIDVTVAVTQQGEYLAPANPASNHTVAMGAGARSATLTLETADNTADDADGSVAARIIDGSGMGSGAYFAGPNSAHTVTVLDDDGPPGAPRNLAATGGDGFVTLTWSEPPQNDSPVIRYEVSVDGGTWQDVGLATTHREENLTNGQEYVLRVRAVNQEGEGEEAEIRATPTERITALPEAPQVLTARTGDASRVRLGWVRPSNAADWHPDRTDLSATFSEIGGYWIQVCAGNCDAETSWSDVTANTGSTATDYVDEGLTGSIQGRSYRVQAVNINGRTGPWSNVATLAPVQVTRLYPRGRPDHQTVEVRFDVWRPDGTQAYLRLVKTGGDRAATDAKAVPLNREARIDDHMTVWFHRLEADTGYEVQLDFVDSFDSSRKQTAFVRTLRDGYPDPYQAPVVETPEETPLIEADVSSVSLVFGQSDDDAATYRIRLVAGACDGGRAEYPYRLAQVSRPDVSSKARHGTDPFHVQGQSPGFVLLRCGTSTSPGPWREVAVQASPLYEYPVAYRGKNQNRAVVVLGTPFGEQVVHAVYNPHWQTWGDYLCETEGEGRTLEVLWDTCDGTYGGSAYRLTERQAPVTLRVDAERPESKAAANLRSETGGCESWQVCLAWDSVSGATGYEVQWRFLNQGWNGRYRGALVDVTSHDFDAAATAEVRMRVRAYSTASLPANGNTPAVYPWVGPWREVTREPLSQPTGLPVIRIGSASVKESGDGTSVTMTFPVTLDRRVDGELTVDWETVDGTALAGEDYQAASGTVTFGTDETQKTISVTILDDDLPDTGETFTVLLSDPAGPGDGARLGNVRATGRIRNHESDLILTGLTLVDAADQSVLAALSDGATVTLDDPDGGSFAVRADAAQGAAIGSVRLELTGAKTESTTDNGAPYSLYGDAEGTLDGESLPVGSYTLQATAYAEIALGGDVLQTLEASFTVEEPAATLSATFPASPFASSSHAGSDDRPQVVVSFSEAVATFAAGTPSLAVTGGGVLSAQTLIQDGLEHAWVFFLDPAGDGAVEFRLVADQACDAGGICTGEGTLLTGVPAARTIPGPGTETEPAAAEEPAEEEANNPATGQPAINGTVQVDETLTADTSGLTDEDGLTGVSYSYQWIRSDNGADIAIQDATASTYELTDDDVGKTIKVRVSFTDDADNQETLTSEATAEVAARPNSPATGAPTISGTAQVDQKLTASTSGVSDQDGLTGVSYSYQWIRSDGGTDTDIQDATASTYELTDDDVGKTIKVRVSFTDNRNNQETLTSAATDLVEEATQPLIASTHGVPGSHDGENVFTFELRFSEDLKSGFSFRTLRDHAFTVTGGDVTRAKRLDGSGNLRWTIHVQPDGNGDVTVVLPVTTDCDAEHAICTGDGRALSNRLKLTVSGLGG